MNHNENRGGKRYWYLGLMALLHFSAMYVLMYAMVDVLSNALPNYNQLYMALLMTAPMLMLEVWFMGAMYPRKNLNLGIVAFSVLLLGSSFFFIREQVAIGDEQFLRSMIPHHAGAILMCTKADLTDPEIKQLCSNIISGQQQEIDWMKTKLHSLP